MLLRVRFLIRGLLFWHTSLDYALLDRLGLGHLLPFCYTLNFVCFEEFYDTPPVIRGVSWEFAYGTGHFCIYPRLVVTRPFSIARERARRSCAARVVERRL